MQVFLSFRHMESTDGLKAHARGKAEKMEKYLLQPIAATMHITFSMERYVHRVDVTVQENKHVFKAQATTSDMSER